MENDYRSLIMAQQNLLAELWPNIVRRFDLPDESLVPASVAELEYLVEKGLARDSGPVAVGRHIFNARAILQTIESLSVV